MFSDGVNVARKGKATQSSTASRRRREPRPSTATRAAPTTTAARRTRSEGTDDPWWEVDLGREVPIEKIVVWNRTDGNLGDRLNNFTVRVLDADKKTVFQSVKNPTPKEKAEFAVGAVSPERIVRKAAMLALASVRGQEADAFKAIAKFLTADDDRAAAVQALLRIPRSRLAEGRCEVAPRRRDEVHPLAAGRRAHDARRARHDATRRGARGAAPAGRGEGRAEGTRRDRRPRHPRRHALRPDELRQGAAHRAGRQAGRVRVREHGHHAAQLRHRRAGEPGEGRQRGRGVRDARPARPRRSTSRHAGGRRAAEEQAAPDAAGRATEVHRAEGAGDLPLRLHLPRPLAADARRALRRRGPRRLPRKPGGVPREEPAAGEGRPAEVQPPANRVEARRTGRRGQGDGGEGRAELRQRQADVHGGDVRRVPQVRRPGQRVRPGPDEARPEGRSRTRST